MSAVWRAWVLMVVLMGQSLWGLMPSLVQAQGQHLAHAWEHAEAMGHHHHDDDLSLHTELADGTNTNTAHGHSDPPTPQATGVPAVGGAAAQVPSAGLPRFVPPHWPPHPLTELLRPPQRAA